MNLKQCAKWFATLGPTGYFPASGTAATVVSLPLVYALHHYIPHSWWYICVVAVFGIVSTIIVEYALSLFQRSGDPSEIVIDECVGTLITFWQIPLSPVNVLLGFMLFRFFDIAKICGISYCERAAGAKGIMLDDVVAALFSNLLLRCMLQFFF